MPDERLVALDLGVADVHVPSAEPVRKHAALAIVHDLQGRVLTVSRPDSEVGEMAIPGGHVEDGESPMDAAVRELREETGLEAQHARHVLSTKSPTDGRPVHVFRVFAHGKAEAKEPGTRVAWMTPDELLSQSVLYRPTVRELMTAAALSPVGDARQMADLDADKRNALPDSRFALPSKRKYPIHDAAHTRNAAARLKQQKAKGKISDADYAEAKKNIAKAAKKFGIQSEFLDSDKAPEPQARKGGSALHIRVDGLQRGGALHVRHMSDRPFYDGEGVLLADGAASEDTKPVWIQLGKQGSFAGHPAGPFELNARVFGEIVDNFKATKNRAIPIDYEHASEQDPTSGSIPTGGAPAQGWIRDLKIEGGNLYGLVEWLPQARDQIRAGQYRYISPAIRFGAKDRVTGKPIGARLTSAGLTNEPFLDGMQPLAARDDDRTTAVTSLADGLLGKKLHASTDVLPKMKAALKLDPLSSADEVGARLEKLRDAASQAGPDGIYAGENLHDYIAPLADLAGMPVGSSWEDLLDALDEFVDGEIEKHVFDSVPMPDPSGASLDDDPDNDTGDTAMADQQITTALKDAQDKAKGLEEKLTAAQGDVTALTEKVSAHTTLLAAKDTQVTELTEKVAARDTLITAKDEEIKSLKAKVEEQTKALKAHADAEETRIVGERFDTYKDKTRLSKDGFLALYRSDRALFDKEFPEVSADERILLRKVTPTEERPAPGEVLAPQKNLTERALEIQAQAKKDGQPITLSEAMSRASEELARKPRGV